MLKSESMVVGQNAASVVPFLRVISKFFVVLAVVISSIWKVILHLINRDLRKRYYICIYQIFHFLHNEDMTPLSTFSVVPEKALHSPASFIPLNF